MNLEAVNWSEVAAMVLGSGGIIATIFNFVNSRKQLQNEVKKTEADTHATESNAAIALGNNAFNISQQLQTQLRTDVVELRKIVDDLYAQNRKLLEENGKLLEANRSLLEENNKLLRENKTLQEEKAALTEKIQSNTKG